MRLVRHTAAALLLVSHGAAGAVASAANTAVRGISIYGHATAAATMYRDDKPVKVMPGQRVELSTLDLTSDSIFHQVDIVVALSHAGPSTPDPVAVHVAVSPKVAPIVFITGTPGSGVDPAAADHEATERAAVWLGPILLLSKEVVARRSGRMEVSFEGVDLKAMVRRYADRRQWPVSLRFQATIEPGAHERRVGNNSAIRVFRVPLPLY
jgi:hypothetical protein